jgi:hypothetical protein
MAGAARRYSMARRAASGRIRLRLATLVAGTVLAGAPLLSAASLDAAVRVPNPGTPAGVDARQSNRQPGAVPRSAISLPPSGGGAGGTGPTEGTGDRPIFIRPSRPTKITPLNTKWTPTSRAYANPDGSYTTDFYPDRVNYRTAAGVWTPIDTSLVPLDNSVYDWTVAANDVSVSLSDANASVAAAQVTSSGYTLRLRIPGYGAAKSAAPWTSPSATALPAATELPTPSATPTGSVAPRPAASQSPSITPTPVPSVGPSPSGAPAALAPNDVVFAGSSGGDVRVAPTSNGFAYGATLSTVTDPNVYAYALDLGNLNASIDSNGQSVTVSDPALSGPNRESGGIIGHVEAPGLTDAAGLGAVSSDVSVTLVRPGATSIPAGVDLGTVAGLGPTEILLVYTINPGWLNDPLRTYPVKLDPLVCIQNTTGCTSGEFSTFVMSGKPTTYPNGWTVDRVGVDQMGTGYGVMRTLTYFPNIDLITSTNSDGAQVISADYYVHQTANYGTTSTQLKAYKIAGTWGTSTTYNGQPSVSGATSAVSACSGACTLDFNVTGITREWYTRRAADWHPEFGFETRVTDEAKPEVQLDDDQSPEALHHVCCARGRL